MKKSLLLAMALLFVAGTALAQKAAPEKAAPEKACAGGASLRTRLARPVRPRRQRHAQVLPTEEGRLDRPWGRQGPGGDPAGREDRQPGHHDRPQRGGHVRGSGRRAKKGLEDRLAAVVGVAEKLPLPDNSVDLVVSRGSIFFWDDPAPGTPRGLSRPAARGKAYIGGGAGSGYPREAVEKLIEMRKERMQGEEAEKWKRFVELRRPEQMRRWAQDAGLKEFEVMGAGAIRRPTPEWARACGWCSRRRRPRRRRRWEAE